MSLWSKVLFLAFILTFAAFSVSCKKKAKEKDPYKAATCQDQGMEGVENIESECKKCCENAGFGYAFSAAAGCNCV